MSNRHVAAAAFLTLALASLGCAPQRTSTAPPPPPPLPVLRVGITPDSPPFCFQQGDRLVGMEIDFAQQLARSLGRSLRVTAMPWESLVPSLLNGNIDVIMSGMTVTRLRQLRVAFADPYLDSGLAVLLRRSDAQRFPTPAAVLAGPLQIGVARDTTGEKFVKENSPPQGQVLTYSDNATAVIELRQRRLDAFVTDLPIVAYFAAENEGMLMPIFRPLLTHDQLAWAFRPEDADLRSGANAALASWRQDGTRASIVDRWLPRWEEISLEAGLTR